MFSVPRSGEVNIPNSKPIFTEIEKNYCISIYTRSDLNKIREETIRAGPAKRLKRHSWNNIRSLHPFELKGCTMVDLCIRNNRPFALRGNVTSFL